jgi:hypothetical protein
MCPARVRRRAGDGGARAGHVDTRAAGRDTTRATGRSSSFAARILMHVTHHNALHIGQIAGINEAAASLGRLRNSFAADHLVVGRPLASLVLLTFDRNNARHSLSYSHSIREAAMTQRASLLQGTLDLLILKALSTGELHGLGVSAPHRADDRRHLRRPARIALSRRCTDSRNPAGSRASSGRRRRTTAAPSTTKLTKTGKRQLGEAAETMEPHCGRDGEGARKPEREQPWPWSLVSSACSAI